MMEERGNPAGLRQAPQERRSTWEREGLHQRQKVCLKRPSTPTIYRDPKGGCASPRRSNLLGGGGQGRFPSPPRHLGGAFPPWDSSLGFPLHPRRMGHKGSGTPAHFGLDPFPLQPMGPSGGLGTIPMTPKLVPMAEIGLPIYKSLPPDHSGTPHDVRDLIRDSEQHSVTTYKLPL